MPREKLFSVRIGDCDVQTFRAGGPGGQNQNKRDTAVRIIHRPSGARAESREFRTQLANKKSAFAKMAATPEFRRWVRIHAAQMAGDIDRWVDQQMRHHTNIVTGAAACE